MLYLDPSALVRRHVAEEGSEDLTAAMAEADGWAICRGGYVECARAIGRAAELTAAEELRTLDALHLAAALPLDFGDLTLTAWHVRLHRAAQRQDLAVFPAELG